MREEWHVQGFLQAADANSLALKMAVYDAAFALDHQDAQIIGPDGSTIIRSLDGVTPLGGVRVLEPVSWYKDGSQDAEGSTFRSYRLRLEGRYDTGTGDVLMEFFEKIHIRGTGGPRFIHLQPLSGTPIKQYVADSTVQRITQSGRAVGLYSWPTPPGPIWPSAYREDESEVTYDDPERQGGLTPVWVNWPVSWTFHHESNVPLGGKPNLWT